MAKNKERVVKLLSFITSLLSVVGIWELIVDLGIVSSSLLPSPYMIIQTFYNLLTPKPLILIHLYKSLYRLLLGYTLGVLLGIALGIAMGSSKFFYRAFSPIVSFLISIPTIAWVPLLLITLGTGDMTIIIAIFLGSFFPVVYNTTNGIRSVEKRLIWASQIMGADKRTSLLKVLLPASLASIITGLRLAIGYSWRALVGAEMLAATAWGVGYMIYAARAFYDVKAMFAGLVIISAGGLLMDRLIMDPIERKTIEKWGMITKR